MNFFIRKNSELPILMLELIKDNETDYKKFYDMLQNSNITFTMYDINSGNRRISCKPAFCVSKDDSCLNEDEYYLAYKFSKRETSKSGTYIGEFTIDFLDGSGELIVPIRNELKIQILENSVKS